MIVVGRMIYPFCLESYDDLWKGSNESSQLSRRDYERIRRSDFFLLAWDQEWTDQDVRLRQFSMLSNAVTAQTIRQCFALFALIFCIF